MFTSVKDKELVHDMKESDVCMKMNTNVGSRLTKKDRKIPGLDIRAWVDQKLIENIFGFANMADQYHITYNNRIEYAFIVHTKDKDIKFKWTPEGLYSYEFPNNYLESIQSLKTTSESQHILTVAENRKNYSVQQYERAHRAKKLYHILNAPSKKNFKYIRRSKKIQNCPVTPQDVDIAEHIFGKDISYLKGKSTRKNPSQSQSDIIAIPVELKDKHQQLTMFIDVMYINKEPFLTTITHPIYYRTSTHLPAENADAHYKALNRTLRIYNHNGFRVTKIECDGKFKPIMDPVCDDMDIEMEYSNAGNHVPAAERNNRMIKEMF